MKTGVHISDLLNYNLNLIGSKLILDSESNEIGEQIAFKATENRFIEIIRLDNETMAWISFQNQGVSLGSTLSGDLNKIIKAIHSFLEDEVELKEFYDNELDIKSPIDISNLVGDEQILRELIWFNFLESAISDKYEPKEWLIIRQLTQNIKTIASSKGLIPYRSLNRVCFSPNINSMETDNVCLWRLVKEDETKEFSIGNYNGNSLKSGSKNEIIAEFKKILEKLPTTTPINNTDFGV